MVGIVKRLVKYRELLWNLTLREIKARYKQSVLGYFWIILNPLLQMIVMSFVFSKLLRVGNLGIPYPVFLYAGLLPWTFFVNSVTSSLNSLVNNASLLKKIYFPREVFILASVLAKLIDFALASTVFMALLLFYRVKISSLVVFLPFILFCQVMFSVGLGLVLAAFNLFYRDIQYLMRLVFTIWFYLTPVIYPVEMMPAKVRWVFKINPMSVLINGYRRCLFGGGRLNFVSLGLAFLTSFVTFQLAYWMFKKLEGFFADVA